MKITTRKYKCFNDSPKDEQEKIMLEVYYKLKNRSFARILYCASLFLILDSLVITLLISTFFKTEPSLAISIIPVFLVTFYYVFLQYKYIKNHFIEVYSILTVDKLRDLLNRMPMLQYQKTLYGSDTYKIIEGLKDSPFKWRYNNIPSYRSYIRVLYSNDDIIRLLDNYTKSGKIKPYRNSKNSLFLLSYKNYEKLKKLINEGKTQEVHELLEKLCK